ncbi:M56 family metallopeptidase [Brevibacterium litoralis]|uniref:M56 family metallopeptidase n=1 Tax=Brevibacterium litoralis TaxID=3138935 RepID=UPI0032EDEB74
MTVTMLTVALIAGLVALAVFGPWLLRHAAPMLVRVPRLAILIVTGGIAVWLGTLLAIGPVLAWAGSGPALLPERAAEFCQRCLTAANPFSADASVTMIPAILLLALPAVLALALGIGMTRQLIRRSFHSQRAARALLSGACPARLHGHHLSLVDTEHPFALNFPARHGGIVLSTGAAHALEDDELAAVLAHEHAHLRQRHHLISAVIEAIAAYLRWVPLVRAAADAMPHYLEIAADNQARREAGTPALVSALVKLGERTQPALPHHPCPVALHAAGPERISQLVRPSAGLAGALPAVAIGTYLLALAALSAAVHLPYASAALTGC